jgi:GNAT superfamily N-acetyltransferase
MGDREFEFVVESHPDPADVALLEERVTAAAAAAAGLDAERELAIFLRDQDDQVLAGISGITWGGYCDLHLLWVAPPLRGRGLARRLVAAAEDEARRRACSFVIFFAYDLLTPGLYEGLGYEVLAVVPDCPAGSSARLFRKIL